MVKNEEHTFKIFTKLLGTQEFLKVALLYGKEQFLVDWAYSEIVKKYVNSAAKDMDLIVFDYEKMDIDELIEHLKGEYDIVIMDGAPGINRAVDLCHSSADEVIIVTTPDYSAIRDADAIEDRLIKNEIMNRHYVLNRVMPVSDDLGCGPSLVEIDLRFRSQLLGVIMEDENIRASCNIGIPIVAKRDTYIARNFDNIADRVIREIL